MTTETHTTRDCIIQEAANLISGDREIDHGDAYDCFGLISTYWTAHLDTNITRADVAVMMTLLKLARSKSGKRNKDNYVDAVGYSALAGEMSSLDAKLGSMD